jgi:hypothetical protein
MVRDGRPKRRKQSNGLSATGAPPRRRRSPSRGFFLGLGAVAIFALFLSAVGAMVAQAPSDGHEEGLPRPAESPIPVEVTVVPPEVTPDPDYTEALLGERDRLSVSSAPDRSTRSAATGIPTIVRNPTAGR